MAETSDKDSEGIGPKLTPYPVRYVGRFEKLFRYYSECIRKGIYMTLHQRSDFSRCLIHGKLLVPCSGHSGLELANFTATRQLKHPY